MRRTISRLMLLVIVCCISAAAFAQSEKVSLRMPPRPNQLVHVNVVQETEMEVSFEGNSLPPGVTGPMKVVTKVTIALTQKTGSANAQGDIEAELTYDEVRSDSTMNGQPMARNNAADSFTGKKLAVTFDKLGSVVNVKVPADVGLPEESFKQMLKSMYGNLPDTSLALGESATVPLDFTIPLPLPGAAPLKMQGDVKHTLASIETTPAGRIAKFDHVMDGNVVSDIEMSLPTGKVQLTVDFKMNGGGAMLTNVDKGVLASSETTANFDGTFRISGGSNAPSIPPMSLHGKTKSTTTSTN